MEEPEYYQFPDESATAEKKAQFLEAYAQCGNLTKAAKVVKMNRQTHYKWLRDDDVYTAHFANAKHRAAEALESECYRRALEGTQKPIYQSGALVGKVREYSDTLAIFLLKGAFPEKYRERSSLEHTGPDGLPLQTTVTVNLVKASDPTDKS